MERMDISVLLIDNDEGTVAAIEPCLRAKFGDEVLAIKGEEPEEIAEALKMKTWDCIVTNIDKMAVEAVEEIDRLTDATVTVVITYGRSAVASVSVPFDMPDLTKTIIASVLAHKEPAIPARIVYKRDEYLAELVVERDAKKVMLNGAEVPVGRAKARDLFWLLAMNPNVVFSKERLVEVAEVANIAPYIASFRDKLGDNDNNNPRFIRSIRGVGYAFIGAPEFIYPS